MTDTAWLRIQAGDLDTAAFVLDLADNCHPGLAESAHLRGIVAAQRGQTEAAILHLREALRRAPTSAARKSAAQKSAEYRVSLAKVLVTANQPTEALALLDEAIRLAPQVAEAHYNRGVVLCETGRWQEAGREFTKALALRPDFANARYNLALAILHTGPSRAGWEAYEARWDCPNFRSPRPQPGSLQWRGTLPAPRHLLLVAEQGIGDTFLFARFIPPVQSRVSRLTLIAPAAACPLLQQSFPDVDVLPLGSDPPPHDAHCPLASLPLALGLDDVAAYAGKSYLQSEPERVAHWQKRLTVGAVSKRRIGLVWAGGRDHRFDARRSLDPSVLAPLIAMPEFHWFSLQCGTPGAALMNALPNAPIIDLAPELTDFAATASAILALDLVISVDTAVANLAGALGAPAWIMLDSQPDWRWPKNAGDFSWYPGLRTFRQRQAGDWSEVVARLAGALRAADPSGR